MDDAFIACRAIQFASLMLAFGSAAFRLYALDGSDVRNLAIVENWLNRLMLASAVAALLAGLATVPIVGGRMAGSGSAGFAWPTISAVLFRTDFGAAWRWHLGLTALLVVLCAIERVRPGYRAALAALSLASLGWIGHAVIGEGGLGIAHEVNQSVHLLAAGIWLGGLVPLAILAIRAVRTRDAAWFRMIRQALPHFSHMGYAAVALVALTGIVNTAILVGGIGRLTGTPYGRVLLVKIALFLLLVVLALVNRLVLAPSIDRTAAPAAATALIWTIGIELALALGIIGIVSVLGTWPPAADQMMPSGR